MPRPNQLARLCESIDHDYARETYRDKGGAPYIEELFPAQSAFVLDPSKYKAALCGRRAGKSHAGACWILDGARAAPGSSSLIIAITRPHVKRIYWKTFRHLNKQYDLGLTFHEQSQVITTTEGSEIWLGGCEDATEADKYRGPSYRRVLLDEGASFRNYVHYLIEDVLEPALIDLDGDLAVVGTPGVMLSGFFWAITTGDDPKVLKWPTYSWDVRDNPHIKEPVEYLAKKRAAKGWDEWHPTYQREWLGKWVQDEGGLVYKFDARKNLVAELPEGANFHYILALDLGASAVRASTAFVVLCYSDHDPTVYVVHSESHAGMIPSTIAERIRELDATYHFEHIVADTGALGKGYVEEFRRRWTIPVVPAEKGNKRGYIDLLNGDLRAGRVKLVEHYNDDLIAEWKQLPWDENKQKPDERFLDHLSDGALYGYRAAKGFLAEPEDDDEETDAARIVRQQRDRVLHENGPWWAKGPKKVRRHGRRR